MVRQLHPGHSSGPSVHPCTTLPFIIWHICHVTDNELAHFLFAWKYLPLAFFMKDGGYFQWIRFLDLFVFVSFLLFKGASSFSSGCSHFGLKFNGQCCCFPEGNESFLSFINLPFVSSFLFFFYFYKCFLIICLGMI